MLFNGSGQPLDFTKLNNPVLFSLIASSSEIKNTTSLSTFNKTYTVPAGTLNSLDIGSLLKVRAMGRFSVNAGTTPTLILRIAIGGATAVVSNAGKACPNDAVDFPWMIGCELLIRTLNGSQAVVRREHHIRDTNGSGSSIKGAWQTSNLVTINWTASVQISVTAEWSAAHNSNTAIMDSFYGRLTPSLNVIT